MSQLNDVVHDCYYDVTGTPPTDQEIESIIKQIPEDILSIGREWGWSDTVFRDGICEWVDEEKITP